MIGHEKIFADLKHLADREMLGHGYIFFGPAMVGKRTVAREFAEFLEEKQEDFGDKDHGEIHDAVLSDTTFVKPGENGSIGIETIREIRNFLWQKPNVSPRRTLIIDDAELLTIEAQNALLKITEEPPVSSLLILVTSDVESILPTIISRLPKIYFGMVPEDEIKNWLQDSDIEAKKFKVDFSEIAKKSVGKPGLAWRLLNDEDFQEQLAFVEKLLKTPAAARRDLIKKIIEPDDFSFRKFLDMMIMVLAWQGASKQKMALWHRALALYDRETSFSLNPRLQLESLLL